MPKLHCGFAAKGAEKFVAFESPKKEEVDLGCEELLQLRTVYESGAQNLKRICLGQINSLQLLAARTGGGAYPVEVCRQGKCDNARLQKTAVRQASVWVRCIRLWHT